MGYRNEPMPDNEMERLLTLSEFDLDYDNLTEGFKDLTHLAAKVAGTEISLVNLIDSFTQWSLASFGVDLKQMPREESACQYTIMSDQPFEVPDLRKDDRFHKNPIVTGPLNLRYYYGLPLQTKEGVNIGALCVLDTDLKSMTPEKVELLEIIAQNVVKRLESYRTIALMKAKIRESDESKKKVAHDIRGPISGIIGLSEIMASLDLAGQCQDLVEFITMINRSSKSLLELADEILADGIKGQPNGDEFNLSRFKEKLEHLYCSQAIYKHLQLNIAVEPAYAELVFSKNKLMQIAGNLISNAIKFTPVKGQIDVLLEIVWSDETHFLKIEVSDNGIGLSQQEIRNILSGKKGTTSGTSGEKGYGFGLNLVVHLVEMLKGQLTIDSIPGKGTTFSVLLPQLKV